MTWWSFTGHALEMMTMSLNSQYSAARQGTSLAQMDMASNEEKDGGETGGLTVEGRDKVPTLFEQSRKRKKDFKGSNRREMTVLPQGGGWLVGETTWTKVDGAEARMAARMLWHLELA